ncbi:hypothetical protein Poly30_16700 [Planctomycetes bacterium Poly30]|uniref:Outer membrane protein beta-barrel domain-containing protein n=1 Tax=Saltatorellus ferox TaxID=2528018 RepID=A0A518EPZ8_9BACT|nr:hypothetical protein Poly30_16700 [Planctomycetes bacterium Poly30]
MRHAATQFLVQLSSLGLAALPLTACATSDILGGQAPRRDRGFYGKALAGYGSLEDTEVDTLRGGSVIDATEGSFDAGLMFGAALGYDIDRNWSLELEYMYRSNDLDEARAGSTVLGTDGDLASVAVMLNAFYRFDTGWALDPYVGLGFGLAQEVDMDLRGGNTGADGSYSTETPAAQFMLGAIREVSAGVALFAEGRFFRAFDPEMGRESGASNEGLRVETEYGHSALLLGARFSW